MIPCPELPNTVYVECPRFTDKVRDDYVDTDWDQRPPDEELNCVTPIGPARGEHFVRERVRGVAPLYLFNTDNT